MKNLVSVLALIAIISSPAFAQVKKKKKVVKTTTTTETTTSTPAVSEPAPAMHSTHEGPELSVNFGLGTLASKFHFGFGFKAQWPMTMDGNDFKFGGQTGFYFGPSSPSTFVIPVLATAQYEIKTTNAMKPYAGIGIGFAFAHASQGSSTVTAAGATVTVDGPSASSTDFAFLFIPGFNCEDGKYYAELPIGVINTSFALLPTVGMHF